MEGSGFDRVSDVELGNKKNKIGHKKVTISTIIFIKNIGTILLVLGTLTGICEADRPKVSEDTIGAGWHTSRGNIELVSASNRWFFIPVVKKGNGLIPVSKRTAANLRIRRSPEDDIHESSELEKGLVPLITWFIQHFEEDDLKKAKEIVGKEVEAVANLDEDMERSTEAEEKVWDEEHSQVGDGTIKVSRISLKPMKFIYYPAVY